MDHELVWDAQSPEFFTEQAQKVGENTLKAIEQLLCTRKYPEQAYKRNAARSVRVSLP